MLLAWHAHCHVVNSGVPSVENGKGGGGGGLKVEVVCFFYFFALVSYVGFAIYTVYMFIQALRFFTTRTTKRETQKKSYAFFSSFLIRSTNAHFTVTVEKKKKKEERRM